MVEEHIKQLLNDHDCVIIPDFGGLITHYVSARIHPVKHTFVPPSRRIAFNEKLKINDGLLISTIAHQYQVPPDVARHKVAEFVKGMQGELRAKYKFEMQGIGLFRFNYEQKIEFTYMETENLLDESFGLPELVSRPVGTAPPIRMRNLFKNQPATTRAADKKTLRSRVTRLYKVAATLVLGGVTFSGLYYLSLQTDTTLSSLNPVSLFMLEAPEPAKPEQVSATVGSPYIYPYSEEEVRDMHLEFYPSGLMEQRYAGASSGEASDDDGWEEYTDSVGESDHEEAITLSGDTLVPPALTGIVSEAKSAVNSAKARSIPATASIKAVTGGSVKEKAALKEKNTAEKNAAVIESETGRFYIISGGYSTLANAEASQKAIKKQGKDSKIILPSKGSRLYRVSVDDFETRKAALNALSDLKTKYGKSIWVLNY